jgi:hypothetical protein
VVTLIAICGLTLGAQQVANESSDPEFDLWVENVTRTELAKKSANEAIVITVFDEEPKATKARATTFKAQGKKSVSAEEPRAINDQMGRRIVRRPSFGRTIYRRPMWGGSGYRRPMMRRRVYVPPPWSLVGVPSAMNCAAGSHYMIRVNGADQRCLIDNRQWCTLYNRPLGYCGQCKPGTTLWRRRLTGIQWCKSWILTNVAFLGLILSVFVF